MIITQPVSWYSFYRPTNGGRLSQPKHCSKGAQSVLKTVYRSSCRDKHNCQQRVSNLSPFTPQSDALTTRLLRPVKGSKGKLNPFTMEIRRFWPHTEHKITSCSKNATTLLFFCIIQSKIVAYKLMLISFGTQNHANVQHQLLYTCPPHLKKCHQTTTWNAEPFHLIKIMWFLAQIRQHLKTAAGHYIVHKLEFETTSVKGAVKSYRHLRWHTLLFFDKWSIMCHASIQPTFQQRADVAGTDVTVMHIMLFHSVWRMYQIILWIHRRATVKKFSLARKIRGTAVDLGTHCNTGLNGACCPLVSNY